MKHEDGFTLFEIIIVLAIIAIISAITIPNLLGAANKSRFKSDIQSIHAMQNAIDLYIAENGERPAVTSSMSSPTALEVITFLYDNDYLKNKTLLPQTSGAEWSYNGNTSTIGVDITKSKFDEKFDPYSISAEDFAVVITSKTRPSDVKPSIIEGEYKQC